jgi:hypothetical protein
MVVMMMIMMMMVMMMVKMMIIVMMMMPCQVSLLRVGQRAAGSSVSGALLADLTSENSALRRECSALRARRDSEMKAMIHIINAIKHSVQQHSS